MIDPKPFALNLDLATGILASCTTHIERRLSDMAAMYADVATVQCALSGSNPVLYEVYEQDVPHENGQLLVVTTVLRPGKIGDEYYMTKGHFHARKDTAEVYLGLQGQGRLLMCTSDGQFESLPFRPGTVGYIPPFWAHRMANVGDSDFIFFGVYPADAGHDYRAIETQGFPYRLVERQGEPKLVPMVLLQSAASVPDGQR